ncbi:rifin [Plasmodium falciparum NF54]|uniref:Rifin n=2 Tax=Plasmodium falciparum TaxID=5833 RepID=Q8IHM5_PLAF7|nr:rifin [Plasmodium falciparum 3D7]EWC87683.1 hypothetical protein PFNF54_03531 [Plasmodium falciparum NF54]KAF4328903.1 rifin [Plasmodium falciparum NF54]PKC46707.1 rifin [Plasmodium falciparum NF54]CZT99156.1 rifin [Plasmodium falciparum 3D7]|eukprot:XP_001348171.1 rifin [Plasmodium falciparum 3D7]
MNLHYTIILFFCLPLNILEISSYEINKNKPYISPHTPTTLRVLSECDLHTSIYDNDSDMKSVKENFDRQTSQRFEEYEERMIKNRKRCKEQCDKDIKKIIVKDKIEKSFAEKLEKGCLRCGFGLGGVAASVGIIGPIIVNELKKTALVAAAQTGTEAGIDKAIEVVISKYGVNKLYGVALEKSITSNNFKNVMFYIQAIQHRYNTMVCSAEPIDDIGPLCFLKDSLNDGVLFTKSISASAQKVVADATEKATLVTKAEVSAAEATSVNLYYAIAYSVIAILVIVLVMVIIFLILRYRRKKKMNKKAQYTKLLNQ